MLVLHLGGEARRLEQPFTVPVQRVGEGQLIQGGQGGEVAGQSGDVGGQPFVDEGHVRRLQDGQLLGFDLPVVF
ncbi:hypothetical protein D3C86_1680290 [compost metagenome]